MDSSVSAYVWVAGLAHTVMNLWLITSYLYKGGEFLDYLNGY
jgi:hypothetical protein